MGPVLVVSCHLDDEVLGCGGFIGQHGDREVHVLTIASRVDGHRWNFEKRDALVSQSEMVREALSIKSYIRTHLREEEIEQDFVSVIDSVEYAIDKVKPSLILVHWGEDVNQDHRAAFHALEVAAARITWPHTIACFEVISSTERALDRSFVPNAYVPLTEDEVRRKIEVFSMYASEVGSRRNAETIKAQAKWRGVEAHCFFAEAFRIVRMIGGTL